MISGPRFPFLLIPHASLFFLPQVWGTFQVLSPSRYPPSNQPKHCSPLTLNLNPQPRCSRSVSTFDTQMWIEPSRNPPPKKNPKPESRHLHMTPNCGLNLLVTTPPKKTLNLNLATSALHSVKDRFQLPRSRSWRRTPHANHLGVHNGHLRHREPLLVRHGRQHHLFTVHRLRHVAPRKRKKIESISSLYESFEGVVLFCFVLVWFGLVWWARLLMRV